MKVLIITSALLLSCFTNRTDACTRVMYKGLNNLILTARSMDWKEDIMPSLWIFPKGMARNGEAGPNSLKWTSSFGSIVCAAYDFCSTDGMNEKGLVANLLWLAESEYPTYTQKKPALSIAAWVQYVLDNFATVAEAVKELEQEKFMVVSDKVPGQDRMANLHLSISDAGGDNAIFEYIKGKLHIYHSKDYLTMTNSPTYDKQLALDEYWKEIGGTIMLPGTNRAADRFVRASFYTEAIPKTDNTRVAVASVFSVIRNASTPYGITTPDQPNISSTRWRSVSDHKNLVYYFETVLTPNTFWVNLKDIDFSAKAKVKKLALADGETYAGNAVSQFKDSAPFKFLGLQL